MSVRFLGMLILSAGVHGLLFIVVVAPRPRMEQHEPLILTLALGKVSVESAPASAASPVSPAQPPPRLTPLIESIPAPTPVPTMPEPKPLAAPVLEPLSVKPRETEELPKPLVQQPAPVKVSPRPPIPQPQRAELMPSPRPVIDATKTAAEARRAVRHSPPPPTPAMTTPPAVSRITAPSPSAPSAPRDQGVKTEARLIGTYKPVYPRGAQFRGWQGTVIVWLEISAAGKVLQAKLHESSGYDVLDQAALRFAGSVEFVPARRGKDAVATQVRLPVRYRLVDGF